MAICKCGGCGEEFTGLSAFDRHQTTAYGTAKPVTCHDPATRGLVRNEHGRWHEPPSEASREFYANLRAKREQERIPGTPRSPEPSDFAGSAS